MGALMAAERDTLLEMTRPPNTILSETVKCAAVTFLSMHCCRALMSRLLVLI